MGQFERFRRMFHTRAYAILLNHRVATILSAVEFDGEPEVGPSSSGPGRPRLYKQRVLVESRGGSGVFELTLRREAEGRRKGCWLVLSFVADEQGDITPPEAWGSGSNSPSFRP